MKYMNFLSSCSYAGLANMLENVGIETEDVTIALDMRLPWLLDRKEPEKNKQGNGISNGLYTGTETAGKYNGGTYLAGAMLQGAETGEM